MNCLENLKLLVLWTTSACNLGCKYCYAGAGKNARYMSFETARQAIDRVNSDHFKIQFAGGEPLLNFELIQQVFQYLQYTGKTASLQIQTNGTLITEKIAFQLKEMGIAIGVSLDGSIPVNDFLRGKTTEVIRGIDNLAVAGLMINLNCVVTGQNVGDLPKLMDLALYLGNVAGVGFDLLRMSSRAIKTGITVAEPGRIKEALQDAYDRTLYFYELIGKRIVIREVEEARSRLLARKASKAYCYAACGTAAVVIPDGSIYPCGSLAGQPKYLAGNVTDDNLKSLKIGISKNPGCISCRYAQVCPGACPSRLILNSGSAGISPQDCALRQAAFELAQDESFC